MKKTRALLFSILLIALAFTSCNLDGTTGIFREIAQSKAPLSIRYKQLLGDDGTYLYFRTSTGVLRVDKATTSTGSKTYAKEVMASSELDNVIQAAAFSQTYSKVFYITNNITEQNNATINLINTVTKVKTTTTASTAFIPSVNLKINNLYANGMIMVKEKDGNGRLFELLKYNGATAFDTSVAQFTLPSTGYGLQSVIAQTGHGSEPLDSAFSSLLVSFVKSSTAGEGTYEHHLVTNLGVEKKLATNTIRVANFLHGNSAESDTIYVLSTDGKLYYAGTYADPAAWVELSDSGRAFEAGAFAYTVIDGTDYHFITKPSLNTSALVVFTFAQTATLPAGVSRSTVQTGYAKDLALVTIVSAQKKASANDLLVATDVNGMYDITIVPATAHLDDGSGTSVGPENYSL